jgi:hypothetical protein
MTERVRRPLLLLLTIGCWSPAFPGTEALSDGVRGCARESDQTQRLACFDTLASTLPKIEADQFGMTADVAQKRDPARTSRATQNDALTGKIVALRQGARGEYVFTLDNEQVWIQAEPTPNIHFAVGDAVRIEHGAMSSIWLAADKGRKTRIKRVQ